MSNLFITFLFIQFLKEFVSNWIKKNIQIENVNYNSQLFEFFAFNLIIMKYLICIKENTTFSNGNLLKILFRICRYFSVYSFPCSYAWQRLRDFFQWISFFKINYSKRMRHNDDLQHEQLLIIFFSIISYPLIPTIYQRSLQYPPKARFIVSIE